VLQLVFALAGFADPCAGQADSVDNPPALNDAESSHLVLPAVVLQQSLHLFFIIESNSL